MTKRCCFSMLIALVWFNVRPARGQDNDTTPPDTLRTYQVDEVVITGTRTYKRIIDVPYSISRVENSQFRFDRRVAIDDVLGVIPGLFLESRYGNHDVRISMRGFGSRSNTGIRGVRILLDGIPESEPDGQTRIEAIDFQSIGSIEVVKGNSSSLYTNAPGGVINFITDNTFPKSFAATFNQFGSFELHQNGFKVGVRTDHYGMLTTYSYHNAEGYRAHTEDFWHILNTLIQTNPADHSTLSIYGYAADGLIRLPGSLTLDQFNTDPLQANPRDVSRDTRRISQKGRLGLRYETALGDNQQHELELTTYGTIKYFERTARTFRVFNRDGLGASGRLVLHNNVLARPNEFSIGTDWFYQSGPIEEYENIAGKKGDILLGLTNEAIGNTGFYFLNTFSLVPDRLDVLLSGRYDRVVFDFKDQLLEVRNSNRTFEDFTPKAALNYKLTPTIGVYASYGLGFDTPAGNELDNFPTSSEPNILLNPDLRPQQSKNFEAGIKGSIINPGSMFFSRLFFETTCFRTIIEDEIVPFEVFGDVFFRNSGQTDRNGIEIGVDGKVIENVNLKAAYTFSDFSYDQYLAGAVEIDSVGNIVTTNQDFSGSIVPSVPKHHLSVSLAYEPILSSNIVGFAKVNYRNVSGMYVDDANSQKSEGYNLFGATLGIDVNVHGFSLLISGGIDNIFDESYVGFINTNSASGEFYELGEPRNYFGGINVGYTF